MQPRETTSKKTAHRISNPIAPKLLTLKEAAAYLGLTPWGLREKVWEGHLPFIRTPGARKLHFAITDLDAYIEDNRTKFV